MTSSAPYALVEDDFSAGFVDQLGQRGVVLLGEVRLTRMRTPQKTAHIYPALRSRSQDVSDLSARSAKQLVTVTLPIGEVDVVAFAEI